jgi:hypothetical protein
VTMGVGFVTGRRACQETNGFWQRNSIIDQFGCSGIEGESVHRYAIILTSIAVAACSIWVPGGGGPAKSIKDELLGTCRLLLDDGIRADGSVVPRFGPNPVGMLIFAATAEMALVGVRSHR